MSPPPALRYSRNIFIKCQFRQSEWWWVENWKCAGWKAEAGEQAVQLPDGDVQWGCAWGDYATGCYTTTRIGCTYGKGRFRPFGGTFQNLTKQNFCDWLMSILYPSQIMEKLMEWTYGMTCLNNLKCSFEGNRIGQGGRPLQPVQHDRQGVWHGQVRGARGNHGEGVFWCSQAHAVKTWLQDCVKFSIEQAWMKFAICSILIADIKCEAKYK